MQLVRLLVVLGTCASLVAGQTPSAAAGRPQLSSALLTEDAQRALFRTGTDPVFKLPINALSQPPSLVNNAAARQLRGDKIAFPVLSTLPNGGSAVFITTLKPCGLILPHVHPRATEQYLIISGIMHGGLSEESTGQQNVTADYYPGQSFLAPQGLLHYNTNRQCTPLVFLQIFNNADPGFINIPGGLAALAAVDQPSITASGFVGNITAPTLGAFALDTACLSRCNLPAGGLTDLSRNLSPEMQALVGLTAAPGPAAPGPNLPTLAARAPAVSG